MRPNIGQFHRAGMSHNTTEYAQRWLRKRLFAQPGLIHPESPVAWHVYRSIAKRCSPETQNKNGRRHTHAQPVWPQALGIAPATFRLAWRGHIRVVPRRCVAEPSVAARQMSGNGKWNKERPMSDGLTLNKITSQRGISIGAAARRIADLGWTPSYVQEAITLPPRGGISLGEAARRIADLGWTPSYVQEAMTFPTDYKISKAPRDPMKQVLRSYFPMQKEKDNRVYGALDAALRGDMFRNVEPRWIEWMKLLLEIIPFPEISAGRSMAMLGRLAPGEELRTGFTMQMVDEFRHSTIQMNLKKWYMENYIDPAGFDITEAAFGKCYATTIGRQFAEGFLTGDAVTAANVFLQVVAETAFTNTLFVAMPSEAARNGDYALPTVFLSVQSEESRHIGNGHSLVMSIINDPDNHLLLERDLRYAFWQNHAIVDAAIGTFIEYGTVDRDKNKESYAELWHRWIYEDYYRTYMLPLEKYGIKIHHDDIVAAWDRIVKQNYVHKVAQFFAVGWPVNFWRIEA